MCRNEIPHPTAHVDFGFMAPYRPVGTCNRLVFRYLHTLLALLAT